MDWWTACLKSDYVIINIDSEIAKKKTEEILKFWR
jgi:hypothetical protein